MIGCLALWCPLLFFGGFDSQALPVRFADVSAGLRQWLGVNTAVEFDRLRDSLDRRTEDRLHQGEQEGSVFFALQAHGFTHQAPIELVKAARLSAESGVIAPEVEARFADFMRACRHDRNDARMRAVCDDTHDGADLHAVFPNVARFLYKKEIASQQLQGGDRRDFVAALYRTRGLSSDSAFDANFPVYLALRQLSGRSETRLERVLIVGPGLEFAPRSGLDDSIPPQSIQPFAVADALLQLGLARRDRLQIHCADINPRVIEYFRTQAAPRLRVQAHPGPDEYRRYFEQFGNTIGKTNRNGESKTVDVARHVTSAITAQRLNIVTERDAASRYDLVIATNVLVYLDRQELALAFANIGAMLADGGFLVHNELRAEIEPIGAAAGLPVMDARMVRLLEDDRRALYDGQVIHRKGTLP